MKFGNLLKIVSVHKFSHSSVHRIPCLIRSFFEEFFCYSKSSFWCMGFYMLNWKLGMVTSRTSTLLLVGSPFFSLLSLSQSLFGPKSTFKALLINYHSIRIFLMTTKNWCTEIGRSEWRILYNDRLSLNVFLFRVASSSSFRMKKLI